MLDYSKIEAGRLDLEQGPFDLARVRRGGHSTSSPSARGGEGHRARLPHRGRRTGCNRRRLDPPPSSAAQFPVQRGQVHHEGEVVLTSGRRARRASARVGCISRCTTPVSASPRIGWTGCSRRSARSTPRRPGATAARAWAWRFTTNRGIMGGRSGWRASSARGRHFTSAWTVNVAEVPERITEGDGLPQLERNGSWLWTTTRTNREIVVRQTR